MSILSKDIDDLVNIWLVDMDPGVEIIITSDHAADDTDSYRMVERLMRIMPVGVLLDLTGVALVRYFKDTGLCDLFEPKTLCFHQHTKYPVFIIKSKDSAPDHKKRDISIMLGPDDMDGAMLNVYYAVEDAWDNMVVPKETEKRFKTLGFKFIEID